MDSTRYVQIICGVCGGKTLTIGGERRPTVCGLCKAPLDARPPGARATPSENVRMTEPILRAPMTFERGTFTGSTTTRPRPTSPASATRPSPGAPKAPHDSTPAPGSLKDKLMRLFTPRG